MKQETEKLLKKASRSILASERLLAAGDRDSEAVTTVLQRAREFLEAARRYLSSGRGG